MIRTKQARDHHRTVRLTPVVLDRAVWGTQIHGRTHRELADGWLSAGATVYYDPEDAESIRQYGGPWCVYDAGGMQWRVRDWQPVAHLEGIQVGRFVALDATGKASTMNRPLCEVLSCDLSGASQPELSQWPDSRGAQLCRNHAIAAEIADSTGELPAWIHANVIEQPPAVHAGYVPSVAAVHQMMRREQIDQDEAVRRLGGQP